MAAILKLRRGTSASPALVESELFYNTSLSTIQVGKSSGLITLVKLSEINTGTLQIVGTISGSNLTLNGDITAQNAYFRGDVRLDGQIILGDVPQDNINVNAQFSGSLIPSQSNAFDLGSQTSQWRTIYAGTINGNITDSNLLYFTQSTNAFTASQETKNTTLGTYTGSIDSKFTTLGTYTGSINSKFVTLGTYTGSIDSKFTTLGTYTSSIDSKFTTLGTYTGSNDTKWITLGTYTGSVSNSITLLNSYTSSQDSKNSTLATYTGSVNTQLTSLFATASNHESRIIYLSGSFSQSVDNRLDQLEATSGSVTSSIALLNVFTSSQNTKNTTLGTYTGSVNNQLTELYSTASNHETRINGIQSYTSSLKTAIGVSGTDVTINGNLSVLGTTTQINSTQVNIGDNILELNYGGSATTAGIITKDATGASTTSGSLLWDATNDYWKGGKLGNESKLLLAGGDNVVSSSAQVVDALKTTFLEINGDSVVSGSSQIDATATTNWTTGIKTQLNNNTVVSGSSQISLAGSSDYVSAIKNRLNIESVISSSIQVDVYSTTNFNTYSQSVDTRLVQLANDSGSQNNRLNNLENFTSSQQSKNSTLATYTGSNDTKWTTLSSVTSSLINATSSYETKGRGIVSGSDQLTASYDLRYANSASFSNLVGAWNYGTQGSLRDAAFYSVTSSADIVLVSGSINYNNNHLLTAGATKKYIDWRTDEILTAIGAADITSVTVGNDGLTGGGTVGAITLSLDTASATFTNGVKTKLNADGVISGSSQIVSILIPLNSYTASQDTKNSTLGTYTGSIDSKFTTLGTYTGSIDSKFTTLASYTGSNDTTITNLNSFSSSINTTIKTKMNTDGVISGSSQIVSILGPLNSYTASQDAKNSTLGTYTGSVDTTLTNLNSFSSSINTTIKTKLNVEGVVSGSSQIVSILGPLNTFSASQEAKDNTIGTYTASLETKNATLATYTGSNDTKWSTLGSLSGSFARINTSNTFNGTQTISGSLYITQDLIVQGSSSIQNISSSNVAIGAAYVTLNTFSPSSRFAGLRIIDSGSAGLSGSFLYDSVDDEFIFVHKGNGTNVTSSHVVMGPETYDNLGNEIYMTTNRIPKVLNYEHIGDSNISDNGVLITLGSNTIVTGTLLATGTSLVSGSSQITLSSTTGGGTSANVQFGSLGIGMAASGTTGRIDATNDIVAYSSSDRRFKDNIKPIENALDKINQIGGYEFDWKEENKIEHGYEGHDLGVIAQEIEAIAPELVQTRENGYKAVKYDKLVSVLIQAVKELSAKVTELENK